MTCLIDNSSGKGEGGGKRLETRCCPTLSNIIEKVRPVREVCVIVLVSACQAQGAFEESRFAI